MSAHFDIDIQFLVDVQLEKPAVTSQLKSSCIEAPQLNGCRPTIARDTGTPAGLRDIDVAAIAADAQCAVNLPDVDWAADAVNVKIDLSWETQLHAMNDLYILATRTAHGSKLYGQITCSLLQNDFVAIQFGLAASRSLDLDYCRIAVDSLNVNAAANCRHLNTRFSRKGEASINFIALWIDGRPYGRYSQDKH